MSSRKVRIPVHLEYSVNGGEPFDPCIRLVDGSSWPLTHGGDTYALMLRALTRITPSRDPNDRALQEQAGQ